jgi:uncharacterized membrane protein (UPF0127 family)
MNHCTLPEQRPVFRAARMRRVGILFAALILAGCGARAGQSPSAPPAAEAAAPAFPPPPDAGGIREFSLRGLRREKLQLGRHTLRVWIMDTEPKREEGMMFLRDKDVKADEGMLFVYPRAAPLSFWMKNTLIPLDIAYLGADRRIIHMAQMKALDETPIPSGGPAQYALELKTGTLKRLNARVGLPVRFPPTPSKDNIGP